MWEFVLHVCREIEASYTDNEVVHFSPISEKYSFRITYVSAQGICGDWKPETLVNQGSLIFPQGNLVYDAAGNKRKRTGRKELRGREAEKEEKNLMDINLTIQHSEEEPIHKDHSW